MFSNVFYNILVNLRICRKPVRKYDFGAPTAITISLAGSDSHDAERRRQIALKALSERLSKTESSPWPNSAEDFKPKASNTHTSSASSPTMLDMVETREPADPLLITVDNPTSEVIA